MKKHISLLVWTIIILTTLVVDNVFGYDGNGTPEEPYQIWTPEQMNTIGTDANDWNKCFELMADVNMAGYTGTQYNIIGNSTTPFTGKFDGNNHTVHNLTYHSEITSYVGLFGNTNLGAEIKNLGVEDVNVSGQYHVGGLIGRNYDGIVNNCFSTGIINGSINVGGLCGVSSFGTVDNCYSTGYVSGNEIVGGLIGVCANGSSVSNCHSISTVEGDDLDVGGLIGSNSGPVNNSYSTGTVSGDYDVGGLIGSNDGPVSDCCSCSNTSGYSVVGGLIGNNGYYVKVSKCHSAGTVSGTGFVGGLIGDNYYGIVSNCYSTGSALGTNDWVGGLIGHNDHGIIWDCYSTAYVEGNRYIGGLIGEHQGTVNSQVLRSFSTGTVSGNTYVGGLLGRNNDALISNCYSVSNVDGNDYVGGLIGENYYATAENCYSSGSVSGADDIGGLIGKNTYSTVLACFWDTQTSGQTNGVGDGSTSSSGVYGRTTAQMQQQATFTASPYLWDFLGEPTNGANDYWRMCADGVDYPRLTFEYIQHGDFACPDGVNYDDFSLLIDDWLLTYLRELYGADADGDETVSFPDFAIFAGNWLEGTIP